MNRVKLNKETRKETGHTYPRIDPSSSELLAGTVKSDGHTMLARTCFIFS